MPGRVARNVELEGSEALCAVHIEQDSTCAQKLADFINRRTEAAGVVDGAHHYEACSSVNCFVEVGPRDFAKVYAKAFRGGALVKLVGKFVGEGQHFVAGLPFEALHEKR